MNYYNEFDPRAANWLRNLMQRGLIPQGYVDERSITEVNAGELAEFTQCHFFAGIGGWPLALQLAGIPADFPCWTGSPPCQPFSVAGRQVGFDDPRHLAPKFCELVAQRQPAIVFGEQVAAAIKPGWLDFLFGKMETEGYACAAAVLPAGSVEAPHKRDRLFFGAARGVADHHGQQRDGRGHQRQGGRDQPANGGAAGGLAYSDRQRREGQRLQHQQRGQNPETGRPGEVNQLAHHDGERLQGQRAYGDSQGWEGSDVRPSGLRDGTRDRWPADIKRPWAGCDWILCTDGNLRPIEPGTFPLANGISDRVVRLRGYGNAIVPQIAAEFIRAFIEAREDQDPGAYF